MAYQKDGVGPGYSVLKGCYIRLQDRIGGSVGRSTKIDPRFCTRIPKFGMEVKCVCVCVCEGVCLCSCQLAKRVRGNGSGLQQKGMQHGKLCTKLHPQRHTFSLVMACSIPTL